MREKKFYTILTVIFWVLASFLLWEFVYELSHMIGAIVCHDLKSALDEGLRMLPMTLSMVAFMFFGMFTLNAYTAKDIKARTFNWKIMSIFSYVLGAAVVICVISGLISGRYMALVEGFPTLLFPLDIMIGGFILIAYGIFARKNYIYLKDNGSKLPYSICRFNKVLRYIGRFFCFLSYCVSTVAFAGFIYGLFVVDFRHGGVFYNICLLLNYFTAFFMFYVYRFVYVNKPNEEKPAALKKYSLAFLVANIIIFALFMLSVQLTPFAPDQNAFGILPVDFIASVNVFMPVYGLNNILVPVVAFLYSLKQTP